MAKTTHRVTIREVAARAGVSTALVSMVLNSTIGEDGKPDCNVAKESAARILNAVKELGYIPNSAAASIRTGKTQTIAVITSDISSRFFSEVCRMIENFFFERGYNVIFASSDENVKKFSNIIKSAMSRNVDGLIILPPPGAKAVLSNLSKFNTPIVFLGRDIPSFTKAGRVLFDNMESVKLEFDALYESGFRNIQVITSDMEISSILDKVKAYKEIMTGKGLVDKISVHYISSKDTDAHVSEMISKAKEDGADSFIMLSNDITTRFVTVINKMKLRIPEDIAFVGFGNSIIYDFLGVPITHIVEPQDALATEASKMLLEMMEGKSKANSVIISPLLVKGQSSSQSGKQR